MRTLTVVSLGIPIILQTCILALLLWRKLHKRFFWFLAYSAYVLVESVVRLVVSGDQPQYFQVYWLTSLGSLAIALFAIWESFRGIFWLETNQPWFRWVFWGCVSLVVAYSSLRAWLYPPQGLTPSRVLLYSLDLGEQYLIAALGLLYFGLIRFFKVVGHQRESTIIWGFGVAATMTALADLLFSVSVTKFYFVSTWLPALGYIVAESAWTRDLLRKEQKVPEPEISLDEVRFALGKYTEFLFRYLGRER